MWTINRFACAAVLAALLSSCSGGSVDDAPLTPEVIESPQRIQSISNRLEPDDRAAFGRYLMGRSAVSTGLVDPLVKRDGSDPKTVREAIKLQRWADGLSAEMEAAQAPHSAVIQGGMETVSTEQYNVAVRGYNAAQDEYKRKREQGPPVDL